MMMMMMTTTTTMMMMREKFYSQNAKRKGLFGDLRADGKIIENSYLRKMT
jgi:hypothetical protein